MPLFKKSTKVSTKNNNTSILIFTLMVIGGLGYGIKTAYSSYITRSKIAEAYLLAEPIQNTLNTYAVTNGSYPIDQELHNSNFGLPEPFEIQGTYISSVVTHKEKNEPMVNIYAYINTQTIPDLEDGNGVILNTPYIKFTGEFNGHKTTWNCTSNLAQHLLPKNCNGS